MQIILNGKPIEINDCLKACDLGDYDIFVRNGYGIDSKSQLCDGDSIVAVKKGQMPNEDNLKEMLFARNGQVFSKKLDKACVCICGLGGLGSNIAAMLARAGVGKLILVDFDIVDPTNLNRQNYFVQDIGFKKTFATQRLLKQINPFIKTVTYDMYLNSENCVEIANNADVVVEAFDNPACKAELVNTILASTNKIVVAASGMAGIGSGNIIKTSKVLNRLYLCGDSETETKEGVSLVSPRVNICAGHQANTVIRLLLGETEC